ncbi:MAG: threonine/serine dehydratase [Candidatus Heimdallarchaeaceae archaeon]
MKVREEVLDAEKRIREYIRKTPLEYSPYLSKLSKGAVYLKLENTQLTNSFKIRGALNKLLFLKESDITNDFITASSGNHGVAFAYGLNMLNLEGTIYLPETASQSKIEVLREIGVDLKFYGTDYVETEAYVKRLAEHENKIYISPYNDYQIIGGQGTIALELEQQLEHIDSVFVPIGGGGLISGIAGYFKEAKKNIQIVGCQPSNSPVMYESIKAGKIIEMKSKPTLSDGTAGGIDPEAITFELCRKFVDDFVLTTEDEIKNSIRLIVQKHFMLVEGAGALSVASFIKKNKQFRDKSVVLILSGSKISGDKLREIFCK